MSNFTKLTRHPISGLMEEADWLDDYFGQHRYGIQFKGSPIVYTEREIKKEDSDG